MKKFLEKFRKFAGFPFVFLLIMLIFFGVTMGTSGSIESTGKSFELQHQTDSNRSWVVFRITAPTTLDENGREDRMSVRLHEVYLNYGKIYSEEETATVELQWGSSTTPAESFWTPNGIKKAIIFNPDYVAKEGDTPTAETDNNYRYIHDGQYKWVAPFGFSELAESSSFRSLTSDIYFRLIIPRVNNKYQNSNIMINEIVFVGEELGEKGEGTGKYRVLPAEIEEKRTYLPYENKKEGLEKAQALLDAQRIPTLTSSSFYQYGKEEQKMLSTLAEMRMGNVYVPFDSYSGDTTYNSLGLDLTYLGTLIFGTSPFGVRFFNVLASFGTLVVGFFFVRRLFSGSDKAGLSFAIIYALAGATISLAHLATPVMLGVFFLLSSLAACYRYYAEGMKKSAAKYTVPLLLSGLCGACAVLVNGAFVVPLAGVVALFIGGVIKQRKKDRVALDEAIAEVEAEQAEEAKQSAPAIAAVEEASEPKKKFRKAYSAYRYNTAASVSTFVCTLLFGIFVFSMLFVLPVSYAANKIYFGITGASPNLFRVAFILFAAGFMGILWGGGSGWNYFYPIFTGTGDSYAVTLGAMNFAATLLGLLGIAFAIYRIVILAKNKVAFKEYMSVLVPLIGLALSLETALATGGSVAFILLAHLFAFALISGGAELFAMEGDKAKKAVFVTKIVALVLLVVCFDLLAVFIFSFPLPAWFMTKLF